MKQMKAFGLLLHSHSIFYENTVYQYLSGSDLNEKKKVYWCHAIEATTTTQKLSNSSTIKIKKKIIKKQLFILIMFCCDLLFSLLKQMESKDAKEILLQW